MNTAPSTGPVRTSKRLLALAALPAALALGACGGGEESTGTSTTPSAEAPAETNAETPGGESAPAEESAPAGDDAEGSAAPEEGGAPEDAGSDPESDPSQAAAGQDGALDIATFKDMEGIDTKVDTLSAADACGYWQGAMSDPASLDEPTAGAQGLKDLAKVSPPQVGKALTGLAGAMEKAKGPQDPRIGQQLGEVEQACMGG